MNLSLDELSKLTNAEFMNKKLVNAPNAIGEFNKVSDEERASLYYLTLLNFAAAGRITRKEAMAYSAEYKQKPVRPETLYTLQILAEAMGLNQGV